MSHPPHGPSTGHDHRHGDAHDGHVHGLPDGRDHAHGHKKDVKPSLRGSLLDASAALRLVGAAGAMAVIWAGVLWAMA